MARLHLSSILSSLALVPALLAGGSDLGAVLPGGTHLSALVDVHAFMVDFPTLSRQGMIGARLDDLAARGFPDPRTSLDALALAGNLGGEGLAEGLALARAASPIVPLVKRVAGEQAGTLAENAYRGVPFVTGTLKGRSSRFADLPEGVILCAFDAKGEYPLARAAVDVLHGAAQSFSAAGGAALAPGTYLSARMTLDDTTRESLGDGKLQHLAHLVGAGATLARTAGGVRLELKAEATGGIKARLAAFALSQKLSGLAGSVADPALKRLLEAAKVERDGATIVVSAEASAADLEAALLATESLVKQKLEARRKKSA